MNVEFIHQTIDRAQPIAEAAGGGKAVAQGRFDVGDARAGILRFNLQPHPTELDQRPDGERAFAGVFEQIAGQLGGGEGNFLTRLRLKAQSLGRGCGADGPPLLRFRAGCPGTAVRVDWPLSAPFSRLDGCALAHGGFDGQLVHQPFGAGQAQA